MTAPRADDERSSSAREGRAGAASALECTPPFVSLVIEALLGLRVNTLAARLGE
jgi:hypothetical protein